MAGRLKIPPALANDFEKGMVELLSVKIADPD
jgi:hypothetical protein